MFLGQMKIDKDNWERVYCFSCAVLLGLPRNATAAVPDPPKTKVFGGFEHHSSCVVSY